MNIASRILLTIIILSLNVNALLGQIETTSDPKKTVVYIFGKDKNNLFEGTGFCVGAQVGSFRAVFLVTAKHVFKKDCNTYLDSIYLRFNKRDSTLGTVHLQISDSKGAYFFTHGDITHNPNDPVDIALLPLPVSLNLSQYDIAAIPTGLFATDSLMKVDDVHVGDDVFFTGLFKSYMGVSRNIPITRFGKISLLTDEYIPMKDKCHGTYSARYYLIEAFAFGGNSGSPVFLELKPFRTPGKLTLGKGNPTFLLGVMNGFIPDQFPIDSLAVENSTKTMVPVSTQNMGISYITPASQLLELINFAMLTLSNH